MKNLVKLICLAIIVSIGTINTSSAALITLDIKWGGGPPISAKGFITFDSSLLEITNPQGGFNLPRSAISDLGITISGASIGNGTFGLGDFSHISFYSPSRLDFGTELIGQSLSTGCFFGVWGCVEGDYNIGNFTLDGATPADPTAFYWFDLTTAGGDGNSIGVVSINPVPLPGSLTLFGLGLAGMRLIRTKKIRDLKMACKLG